MPRVTCSIMRCVRVMLPVLLSIGAAGCQTTKTQISATDFCAAVHIVRYSRHDTLDSQKQNIENNAALAVICK